jgi:glycosyltransferase involved in cell wall biosynthesis
MGILRRRKHHFGYRLMSGLFDQIHTVSECVRQYTIEHDRADPARTITVHNGIDPEVDVSSADVDRLRQTLGLKPNAPVVITVANSRFVKGLDVLLRAAALVTKEVPEAQFIVVGGLGGTVRETAFNQRLLQLHASLGISNCVKFVGKSTEVNALLALSDVFVLPSRSEGLSNALLEAMRAGLPCVATSVGGNPEVVVDGKTGFLVPAEDCETLADRIHRVLRDPGMRDAMGRAGRARLLERFTVQRMLTDLVASYHLALAGNRTPVQPHFAKHALS